MPTHNNNFQQIFLIKKDADSGFGIEQVQKSQTYCYKVLFLGEIYVDGIVFHLLLTQQHRLFKFLPHMQAGSAHWNMEPIH